MEIQCNFFIVLIKKKGGGRLSCDYGTAMHGLSVKSLKLSLYSWGTCCIRYRNEMLIHIDTIVFAWKGIHTYKTLQSENLLPAKDVHLTIKIWIAHIKFHIVIFGEGDILYEHI
jgi:hypothetical protein